MTPIGQHSLRVSRPFRRVVDLCRRAATAGFRSPPAARSFAQHETGVAFVEIAMILPVFALVIAGALEVGTWFAARSALTRAVEDTLQAAATLPASPDPAWQDDAEALIAVFDRALGDTLLDRRVRVVAWTADGGFVEAPSDLLARAGDGSDGACTLPEAPNMSAFSPGDGERAVTVQACGKLPGRLTAGILSVTELATSAALQSRLPLPLSCLDLHNAGIRTDGMYRIDPDGAGPDAPIDAYCDMTNGGWMLIAAQFEDNPVGWDAGVGPEYDPSLASGQSFAFSADQIPAHTEVAFGLNATATYVDVLPMVYTTGEIDLTQITATSGSTYHIYRGWTPHDPHHLDPEFKNGHGEGNGKGKGKDNGIWGRLKSCLILDRTGGPGHDWWFCPEHPAANHRGAAMAGHDYRPHHDAAAWTLWVR